MGEGLQYYRLGLEATGERSLRIFLRGRRIDVKENYIRVSEWMLLRTSHSQMRTLTDGTMK